MLFEPFLFEVKSKLQKKFIFEPRKQEIIKFEKRFKAN
jgi:hypothetical protein